MIKYLVILFFSLLAFNSFAQQQELSTDNKKAIKYFTEAQEYFNQRNNEAAEISLLSALEKDPNFFEAQVMLAYTYTDMGKLDKAIISYEKAIKINPTKHPECYSSAGLLYLNQGKYEQAKNLLSTYLTFSNTQVDMQNAAKQGVINCDFAINAIKHPVPYNPVNLGEGVNTKFPEYFPSLTADGSTLLFTRRINDDRAYGGVNEDFYVSYKEGEKWGASFSVKPLNSLNNEGAPTISTNGRFLIFTSCATPFDGYGEGRNGYGSCDLFYAYKIGDKWTRPKNLRAPINTPNWETQPSFSSDGKTLYFIRGYRSRQGIKNQDIWTTELKNDGTWSKPIKLSNVVNTPGNEESVFIHPDGKTLYFSSDGHPGMGGLDIYMTKKDKNGKWQTPINLGYPINTHANENSLLVSADGKLAYFASNREGGYGGLDLYHFELPEKYKPELVTYLKGKVFDAETKENLGARFELIDLETGEIVVQSYADEVSGEYLVCLPGNRDYALNVSHNNYLFHSENFTLTEGSVTEPFKKDVGLNKLDVGEKVVLKNVFFETAKFDLKPQSKIELNKLINFLKANPTVNIELSGHTDNIGNEKDNLLLSQNRAKAVFDYLVANGINNERLTSKGYGDKQPISDNDTEKGRSENRRTEFIITSK